MFLAQSLAFDPISIILIIGFICAIVVGAIRGFFHVLIDLGQSVLSAIVSVFFAKPLGMLFYNTGYFSNVIDKTSNFLTSKDAIFAQIITDENKKELTEIKNKDIKLSKKVFEMYKRVVNFVNPEKILKFNFFIKQLKDFENVLGPDEVKKRAKDIINQIENSIIAENPSSTLEIKENDLVIATPQKIIDNMSQYANVIRHDDKFFDRIEWVYKNVPITFYIKKLSYGLSNIVYYGGKLVNYNLKELDIW